MLPGPFFGVFEEREGRETLAASAAGFFLPDVTPVALYVQRSERTLQNSSHACK
jgi:hypothetical protein